MSTPETDRIVAAIDETRRTEHWRDHDGRPQARVFRQRRVAPEIVRAQTRLRTAHWRTEMDRRAAPDSREIGMALVHALITTRLSEMTRSDRDILARALMDLDARGYNPVEAQRTLRRLRNRYVDNGDRASDTEDAPF